MIFELKKKKCKYLFHYIYGDGLICPSCKSTNLIDYEIKRSHLKNLAKKNIVSILIEKFFKKAV